MALLVGMLVSVLDGYLFSIIVRRLNRKAKQSHTRYILFIALFAAGTVAIKTTITSTTLSLLLASFFFIILVSTIWGFNRYSFISCVVAMVVMLISEFLVVVFFSTIPETSLFSIVHDENANSIFATLFSRTILFILVYALFKRDNKTKLASVISTSQLVLFTVAFIMVFCILFEFFLSISGKPAPESLTIIFVACAVTFLLVALYIMDLIMRYAQEKEDIALMAMQQDFYLEMQSSIHKLQELKHDYRHHLQDLNTLLEKRLYSDAGSYLSKLEQSFEDALPTLIENQPLISSIIMRKQEYANSNNIIFEIDVAKNLTIGIEDTELSVIFNNLLENAFEACVQTDDKYVKLSIKVVDIVLFIDIINSSPEVTVMKNGLIKSTKSAPEEHGYGLRSVRRLVNKHGGQLTLEFDTVSSTFRTMVSLFVDRPPEDS